ncbi:MAG: cyclase family protein [Dehalococcoidia bacterium]|nr:cyclase family protein [Dehalococcoidia bacterium]
MPRRPKLVDLTLPLETLPFDADGMNPRITHLTHETNAERMTTIFGCQRADLPGGIGWASDRVELATHAGTHLDAPFHFWPQSEGKRAITIDEVPLDWCYSDGVVLDVRHLPAGALIGVDDVKEALRKIEYELKPMDIVMIMTGASKLWGTPEYFTNYPGMGRESTLWLIDRGIKVMGTDAWGWDRPFRVMAEEFARTGDKKIIWGGHFAGIDKEYLHIEKLANLDKLPPHGFKVSCFPIPVSKASAGWVRVVAFLD